MNKTIINTFIKIKGNRFNLTKKWTYRENKVQNGKNHSGKVWNLNLTILTNKQSQKESKII